jgi:LacI family transcriptional regulator
MAEAALDMLIERVQGKRGPPRHRVFAPELAVRRSCGAPPERMPARARTPRGKSAREAKQANESKIVLSNT